MKTLLVLLTLSLAPTASVAWAQDVLEEAKAQYASAAYEEAVATLAKAEATPAAKKVEIELYRAFCFIALGRTADAEQAVASLVAVDPRYVPSPTVASPKVLQMLGDMRRKELPGVARKLLDEGRAAYKDKQLAKAQQTFTLLLQVLDDPTLKQRPEMEDIRILAEGFVALADATATQPKRDAAAAAPTAVGTNGSGNGSVNGGTGSNGGDGAHAAGSSATGAVEPPTVVQQMLPVWEPPDELAGSRDYLGSIKITIGTDGRVKSATIETPTHPIYDARLLQVARTWTYKPARRNGAAVESEKVIAFNLRKRN